LEPGLNRKRQFLQCRGGGVFPNQEGKRNHPYVNLGASKRLAGKNTLACPGKATIGGYVIPENAKSNFLVPKGEKKTDSTTKR